MRRRHKLAAGALVLALVVVGTLGLPAGAQSGRALASTVRPANVATAVAPPRGNPVLSATFGGTHLNTKLWDTCYPKDSQTGCTNFGNKEYEWYLPSQVIVGGGRLALSAARGAVEGTTADGTAKMYYCRSGMVTSYPGFKFQYGFVQVVADVPHATGLWPALWLAAANGQYTPEVDMLESWGVRQLTGSFFHALNSRARATYAPSLTRGWHTYSLSWTRSKLTYYVDSRVVLTVTRQVPRQPMYFLANLAEYLPAKAGDCSGQMLIKSVKIWKG
jgi:beta-glucanase (GH16 family)